MQKIISQLTLCLLIGMMMIVLILFPAVCIEGATQGLLLWFHKLLPSLLPFMILMNLLCSVGIFFKISHSFSPVTKKLFGLSGPSFMLFLLGLVGGYPMGAKLTKQLLDARQISYEEASKTLCFATNCGPIFIIGTVGTIMLSSTSIGYFLLFVHLTSAFTMLILSRFYHTTRSTKQVYNPQEAFSLSLSEAFTKSVQNAMDTIVYVGGYIIFFSVIIHLIKASSLFYGIIEKISALTTTPAYLWEALTLGSLEFSNGAALVTQLTPLTLFTLALLSSIIAFGGFCVVFQCSYVLQGSDLPLATYVISKSLQALIAFCLTFILAPAFTSVAPLVTGSSLPFIFLLLILCFFTSLVFRLLGKHYCN